jgi:uncharacterized protein YjbI with pentapeptide repeats
MTAPVAAPELVADCGRCAGLCCVALPFGRSADFAIDKPAGTPCPNLEHDFGCGIHAELRPRGFSGCVTFDCFGAGQRVSQVIFGGRDWRSDAAVARAMFAAFDTVRQLHELLWYLTQAVGLADADVRSNVEALRAEVAALAAGSAHELGQVDVGGLRETVGPMLEAVSVATRAEVRRGKPDRRGADLAGARLRAADLSGISLRSAVLIAADLRNADLRGTDLLGTDLRNADLSGADLFGALYLTQAQVNAARGDVHTRIPSALVRPAHW